VLADFLNACRWSQIVQPPVDAQAWTRNDQLVDLGGAEMLEERGDIVIDAVPFEVLTLDQLLEFGEAADVQAEADTRVECRQPPGLGGAHRHP